MVKSFKYAILLVPDLVFMQTPINTHLGRTEESGCQVIRLVMRCSAERVPSVDWIEKFPHFPHT